MKVRYVLASMLLAAWSSATHADDPVVSRFLIPIASFVTPGAFGSQWHAEIWVRNEGTQPAWFQPSILDGYRLLPGLTAQIPIYQPRPRQAPGIFLQVFNVPAEQVRVNVRVVDSSRFELSWGTEIPVLRESDLSSGRLTLINVPTNSRFRLALRVYEAALEGAGRVRVAIFDDRTGSEVASEEFALPTDGLPIVSPGYAQVLSLRDRYPAIAAAERIRIEITPLTEGSRIWAFVAVTNNETQHVTTITPQ